MKDRIKDNYEIIIGGFIIAATALFIWFFSYMNEPIGDDILFSYENGLAFYLDDYDLSNLGERITSVSQVFSLIGFFYTHWSGRMTGYSIEIFGKLLPKIVLAFITSTVLVGNVLLAMRIIYKDMREVLKKPLVFLVIYLAVYWYRWDVFYSYMWIMVCVYSISVLGCLLYYNLVVVNDEKGKKTNIILLQIIGFLAGFSHEVLSFCILIPILYHFVISIHKKEKKFRDVYRYIGFILGYILCFFSPGNFYRAGQSNETIIVPYHYRLLGSLLSHSGALMENMGGIVLTVVVTAIFIILLLRVGFKDNAVVKEWFGNYCGIILAIVVSIFVWAFFPRTPSYGMELYVLLFYISIISYIHKCFSSSYIKSHDKVYILLPFVLIIALLIIHTNEIKSYYEVRQERIHIVQEAEKNNLPEVVIPCYPLSANTERFLLYYLNSQYQYDSNYYIAYYGRRLVIGQ